MFRRSCCAKVIFIVTIIFWGFQDVWGGTNVTGSQSRSVLAFDEHVSQAEQFLFQYPDSAISSMQQLMPDLMMLPDDSLAARAYFVMATSYYLKDYYRLAVSNYERALQTSYGKQNGSFRIRVINNLGVNHDLLLNHDEALRYYIETLAYEQEFGSPVDISEVYNNIALVYISIGNNEAALEALNRAEALITDEPDAFINGLILQNMAIVYHAMERYDEAMQLIEQAIDFFGNNGFYHNKLQSVLNLAINLIDSNMQFEKAESLLLSGIEEAVERDIPLLHGYMKVELAHIALIGERPAEAIGYLDIAGSVFDSMEDPFLSFPLEVFRYRMEAYAKLGNADGVRKAMQNYVAYSHERDIAQRARAVEELKTELSYNETLAEIQQKTSELEKQRIRTLLAASIAVLLLFTTLFLIITYRQREKKLQQIYRLNQRTRAQFSMVERLASEEEEEGLAESELEAYGQANQTHAAQEKYAEKAGPSPNNSINGHDHAGQPKEKPENAERWVFNKLQKIIADEKLHLENDLSLMQLSSQTGVSARSISASINYYSGCSFNHFINDYRVRSAIELLEDETKNYLSIDAIYEQCGFSSKTTFYSAFDRYTGMTPNQYRKISQS